MTINFRNLATFLNKSYTIRIEIPITHDEKRGSVSIEDMLTRVRTLATKAHATELVRVAARNSIIENLKLRFNQAEVQERFRVETERVGERKSVGVNSEGTIGGSAAIAVADALDAKANDPNRVQDTSTFGARVESVLEKMARSRTMGNAAVFGEIRVLDKIPTSAGPRLKAGDAKQNEAVKNWQDTHPTGVGEQIDSLNTPNILWRQLEFGTGVYAKPRRRYVGITKDPWGDGSWRFNKVHALGSQPGDFLRNRQMARYSNDAVDLQRVLAKVIETWLRTGVVLPAGG